MTTQPAVAQGGGGSAAKPSVLAGTGMVPFARGERESLPARRRSTTTKVHIGGAGSLYVKTGEYADGRLGEIFLTQSKTGTFNRGVLEGFAISFSVSLQYGTPLQELVDTFRHTNFEPNGQTDDSDVPLCTSVFDYIVQRLEKDYLNARSS